jgi:hypothetical protein
VEIATCLLWISNVSLFVEFCVASNGDKTYHLSFGIEHVVFEGVELYLREWL